MRSGLLIPIGNDALAFAFIAAIIITILWLAFQAISHINKKNSESTFNRSYRQSEHPLESIPKELSQLLNSMPLRRASIEGGTVVFWTNDGPISLAVARANPQSLFKVFLRTDRPASELGHKIFISNSDAHSICFNLTAESLIFSGSESTLYDVDADSLNSLAILLKEYSCSINNEIVIPMDAGKSLVEWISQVILVHTHSQERLLIGG